MARLFVLMVAGAAIVGLFSVAPAGAACPPGTTDPQYCTPSAPEATTQAASNINPTSAQMNGAMVPNGQATTYFFEYGTAANALTSSSPPGDGGSDYASHPVNSAITGLTPSTTYFFRIVATNASGTVRGEILQFTTPAGPPTGQPPAAVTVDCSDITATTARLNGTVNPNGLPTNYFFEFGQTTDYGVQTAASSAGSGNTPQNVSADILALQPSTTYHFRVIATNGAGQTRGEDKTCVTPAAPPLGTAPTVITGPANSITTSSATLTGTVNPNGTQTFHAFQYGLTTDYDKVTPALSTGTGTDPQAVSAVVTGLQPATTYHYRVVAGNTTGQSAVGQDRTFTTDSFAVPPPDRGDPRLTIKARPKRDLRKPFSYKVSGRLLRPAGVSRAAGCNGRVRIRIARAKQTVARKFTPVRANCTYKTRVTIKTKLKKRRGQLRVRNRFLGNPALKPVWSKRVNVYYGPRCTRRTGKCTGRNQNDQ